MSGSLDVLGMLNPGMAGFAAAPSFDYGSALGAMNPGMTGFGGGATNVGGFDAMAPLTDNSSWLDRNAPSNKQLQDALGALGKGAGPAGGGAAAGKGATGGPALGGGGAGVGRGGGVSLTPLLQLLAKRREDLMNSATAGVGMGQPNPQGAGRVQGLLGF